MKYLNRKTTRTAYSSDGSIYALEPESVLQIRSESDAVKAISDARSKNISITPRGGGTGLAGGAVGKGLILDFSQYREILNIDVRAATVSTQVGIIYDELNLALKEYGLFFPPDPSSGDSCQIGGMIANNSSGPRSVKYGLMSEFVDELGVILAGGEKVNLKSLKIDSDELNLLFNKHPEFEKIFGLLKDNSALIKDKWPKLKKNSAGYNLFQVIRDLDSGFFNLPALITGSEGTLCLNLDVKLRLLPIPEQRLTIRAYFDSVISAGEAVEHILRLEPSGLEIVDGSTLNLIGRKKYDIPENAAALLLVEFDESIEEKKHDFKTLEKTLNLTSRPDYATDPSQAAPLWRARKAIVPTLYRHHKTRRPIPLVEDVSIPPDKIPNFISFITNLFDAHGLIYGIFGHIGDGNLHIRPLFDINDKHEFDLARNIYDKVYDKVISIGGSTTAEHADGRLRASLLKKLYGEDIFGIFRQFKDTLDPENILSSDSGLDSSDFTPGIDFEKLKSFCAACGKCNGYCPAYDIFRREDYSPRGWLRIINQSGSTRGIIDEHLSYCLNCKNCTIVCPAGVDIAGEIMSFRAEQPALLSRLAAKFADHESILGISLKLGGLIKPLSQQFKNLPEASQKSLRQRFPKRISNTGSVALFHGCADNLFESKVGEAIFKVFDHFDIDVVMPEQKCCGLPYEVYGLKENLIEKAKYNINHLIAFDAIITGCASCLLRLKEYKDLFENNPEYELKAKELSGKCFDISQFLNQQNLDFSDFAGAAETLVTYHNPCHLRAAELHHEPNSLMANIKGIKIIEPLHADRCCGQAGSYGYTHRIEARQMFAKKKASYENIEAEYLMTSCPACQMKVRAEMGSRFKVVHPVEILADRLDAK